MALTFSQTDIHDVLIIEPQVFWDHRWFFMETYNKNDFLKHGLNIDFIQDNHSKSKKGVFRGFHFQTEKTQTKLVRVLSGKILDFAIDLRKNSPSYRKHVMIELSGENKKQLLIPKWCAHGFISLDDNTEFVYKCDDFYNPNFEGGIAYNDPDLMIDWEKIFTNMNLTMSDIILAEKDKHHPTLQEFHSYNPF